MYIIVIKWIYQGIMGDQRRVVNPSAGLEILARLIANRLMHTGCSVAVDTEQPASKTNTVDDETNGPNHEN